VDNENGSDFEPVIIPPSFRRRRRNQKQRAFFCFIFVGDKKCYTPTTMMMMMLDIANDWKASCWGRKLNEQETTSHHIKSVSLFDTPTILAFCSNAPKLAG
jgi:hypothetical protein